MRPNPIGTSIVTLVGVKGLSLLCEVSTAWTARLFSTSSRIEPGDLVERFLSLDVFIMGKNIRVTHVDIDP